MRLTDQIIAEFEREQRANPDGDAQTMPSSYEAMTPQWLTRILCADHPGAEVTAFRLDAEDEGTTNRRRIFLTYNDAGSVAGLPKSVFCKATHKLTNRLSQANVGNIEGEVTFYLSYRALLDIEAPKSLYAEFDARSYNSIVVLEDLASEGAIFCDHKFQMTRALADSQVSLLGRLHGKFSGTVEEQGSRLLTFEQFFGKVDSWFGLAECCTNGFLAAESVIPARLFRRSAEIWPATLKSVEVHAQQPRTFTHVDTHLRNWYVAGSGRMGLGDWQTLSKGHGLRDVAYAMSTSLSVENRRAWEKDLLRIYLAEFEAAGGAPVSFEDAWRFYRQHLFTSLAWWTLTLTPSTGEADEPVPELQPEAACLLFIQRMATAIDDLDALASFD